MTAEQARKITRERLEDWTQTLAEHCATPLFGIGVSHGPPGSTGDIHILLPLDMPMPGLVRLLRHIAGQLERGEVTDAQ